MRSFISTGFLFLFFLVSFSLHGQITQVTGSPASATSAGTSITIPRPSGLATGDLMIVNIGQALTSTSNLSNANLAGWSLIDGRQAGNNGDNKWWCTIRYRVATSADVAAANFTFDLDNDAESAEAAILAFRNVNTTGGVNEIGAPGGPFDVDPQTIFVTNTGVTTITATSTATVSNQAAVIMLGITSNDQPLSAWQTATGPLVLTELYDLPFDGNPDMNIGAAWAYQPIAGSTGTGTATIGGNSRSGGLLVALKQMCDGNFGSINIGSQVFCPPGNPTNINFLVPPTVGFGTPLYQWYYKDGYQDCPTGTSTAGWTLINGATNSNYNPGGGLLISRTYSVQVDPTGSPDCGPPTWTSGCRKITVLDSVDFGVVTNNDQIICVGGNPSDITLATPPSGGSNEFEYQWYSKSGIVDCPQGTSTAGWIPVTGATLNHYNPPAGLTFARTYAVLVTPTGTPVCDVPTWATGCRKVTVSPVVPAIQGGASTVCVAGTSPPFTNAYMNGVWSVENNGGTATINMAGVVTGGATGNVIVIYTATDVNGCTASVTASIDVISGPSAGNIQKGLSDPGPQCGNLNPSATISFFPGAGGTGYLWQKSANGTSWINASTPNTNSTYDPPTMTATTYYRRLRLSGTVCPNASSNVLQYIVYPNPVVPQIGGGAPLVCIGQQTPPFTNALPGGVWSVTSPQAFISSSGVATGLSSGSTSVKYLVTDAHGCTDDEYRLLNVGLPSQLSPIHGPATLCSGDGPLTYMVNSASGVTYNWSVSNPNWIINSGQGTNSITLTPGLIFPQTLTVVPSNGCGNGPASTLVIANGDNPFYCTACGGCSNPSIILNPILDGECSSFKVAFVLDESGSMADDLPVIRQAVTSFIKALNCTGISVGFVEFNDAAHFVLSGYQVITPNIVTAINNYFDHVPNGQLVSNAQYTPMLGTNFHAGLLAADALPGAPDLVIFVTDGNPTHVYLSNPPPPFTMDGISCGSPTVIYNPMRLANKIKCEGTHMFGLGIGNPADVDDVVNITGTIQHTPFNTISNSDYSIVDFDNLTDDLGMLSQELCPFSSTVTHTNVCANGTQGTVTIHVPAGSLPFSYRYYLEFSQNLLGSGSNINMSTLTIPNLGIQSYRVEVDILNTALGCLRTETHFVNIGPSSSVGGYVSNLVDPTCENSNGGSAKLTITLGRAPFTITLKLGATTLPGYPVTQTSAIHQANSLAAGDYTIEFTDANNCLINSRIFSLSSPSDCCLPICPEDVTISCETLSTPIVTGSPTNATQCGVITYADVITTGSCAQETIIERQWSTAATGAICIQNILVRDQTSPMITVPNDLTLVCTASTLPANTGFALASDACDANPQIASQDFIIPGSCTQSFSILRMWIAADGCQNYDTSYQQLFVIDTIKPVLVCPANITINYGASTAPANTGSATVSDFCDNSPVISYIDSLPPGPCPEVYTIHRKWKAIDACSNQRTCVQMISILDHGTICGLVHDDLNQFIGNVQLKLWADVNSNQIIDGGDQLLMMTNSGAGDGTYCFTNLKPCQYIVEEVQPAGYGNQADYDTTPDADGDDSADGPDNEIPVNLSQGESDLNNVFVDIICPSASTVLPLDTICSGQSLSFQVNEQNIGAVSYQWNFDSDATPMVGMGTGPHSVAFNTPVGSGIATDSILLSVNKSGCPSLIQLMTIIKVNDIPNTSIQFENETFCYFTEMSFQPIAPQLPGALYQWNFGANASPSSANGYGPHEVYYNVPGLKSVKLVIQPEAQGAYCPDSTVTSLVIVTCPGQVIGRIKSLGEMPISGVTVRLLADSNHDGVADGGPPIRTVLSNATGLYVMASLLPGGYVIVQTQPVGWESVNDFDNTDDGDLVSNISMTDNVIPVTILNNEIDSMNNFIEIGLPGTILGAVFVDLDNDLIPDPEEGLGNVVLKMLPDGNADGIADNNIPVATLMTTANGQFLFNTVPTGTYVLVENTPSGYISFKDFDPTNDGDLVPNINMNNDTIPVTLANNESDVNNYFIDGPVCPRIITNTNDAGYGSYRYSVDCANPGDTLVFYSALAGQQIELASQIIFNKNLVTISALSPRVSISSGVPGLFTIMDNHTVEFIALDIVSGNANGNEGAAFENLGVLKLNHVHVKRNPFFPAVELLIRNGPGSFCFLSGDCVIQQN